MNELETLKRKVEELERFVKSLQSDPTIPLPVDQAFRSRLANTFTDFSVSAKSVDSEDVSVRNAADNGSEVVLDDPDGFLQVTISGVTYYVPYYSS